MHLAFDIFQGIGIAAALGIRPFLPALAVGALAAGNIELHFSHTDYSFLQSWPFLLAMVLAAIAVVVVERRLTAPDADRPLVAILAIAGAALGALMFAGSLARGHYLAWPGWIGGVACAALALAASRPLFARVRGRLDQDTAAALPAYAEVIAVVVAILSVVAPPVGPIALALLIWLIAGGRRREGQKYAGLRILR
jgi:hypothetical protein